MEAVGEGGSQAGRRARAFEGWGLISSVGGTGGLGRQKNGEWRNGSDGLG